MAGEQATGEGADADAFRVLLRVPNGALLESWSLLDAIAGAVIAERVRVEMRPDQGTAFAAALRRRGVPVHRLIDPGELHQVLTPEEYATRDARERVRDIRERMLQLHPVLGAMATMLRATPVEPPAGCKWVTSLSIEAVFDGPALPEKVVVLDIISRHTSDEDDSPTGEVAAFLSRCEHSVAAAMRRAR